MNFGERFSEFITDLVIENYTTAENIETCLNNRVGILFSLLILSISPIIYIKHHKYDAGSKEGERKNKINRKNEKYSSAKSFKDK